MIRIASLAALFVVLVGGCSSPGDPITEDTGGPDLRTAETFVDGVVDLGEPDPDTTEPPAEITGGDFDVSSEVEGPACQPGEGCFLDPCDDHEDCQSNWCVQHLGDKVCSITCQTECPSGWSCNQVAGTEPDLVFVCVSNHANLCKPCTTVADCKSAGGAEDVCVDYGAEGNFCGGGCVSDDDCPWGFSCSDALTVNRVETQQCVAEAGVCPCTDASVELALSTPCAVTNEMGTCTGQRTCTEDGLSDCDAATPAAELCNGLDDDCDGQVDEPAEIGGDFINLCDDGNDCTADTCQGAEGCFAEALDGVECMDGDICTVADHCVAGVCVGDPVICDDQNPCTDNACTETGGCEYTPNTADCDDGDPCTVADRCAEGTCSGTAISCDCLTDQDCLALEDGDLCNGTLVCDTGSLPHLCTVDPETPVDCPGPLGADAYCLAAYCDPASGACSLAPINEGFACEDGDPCTMGDTCQAGVCTPGAPLNCEDGDPCTDDSCDPQAGGCVHAPNAAPCTDFNVCTLGDLCAGGACVPGTGVLVCDDGNACTADSCDPELACVHTPAAGPCEDGNPCTTGETCQAGACAGGAATVCDDENPCTLDACNPLSGGCTFTLHSGPCNDNDVCTLDDHCHLGECIAGSQMVCDDGSGCTADSCNPLTGCVFTVTEEPCCTGGTQACDALCVDVQVDPSHCGDCDTSCDPGQVCTGGQCKATCGPDQQLCGDLCTNVLFDPANCGDCGDPCDGADHASGVCISGQCATVCDGTWSDCNLNMEGDGCEANLLTDPDHCGFCGEACATVVNGTRGCENGQCEIVACVEGFKDCDTLYGTGCEADISESVSHCGDCNQPCVAGEVCEDGICVQQPTSFVVHETKDITYSGIDYLLLKVSIGSATATTENWCREYQTLCESFGYAPTGCGYNWPSGYYETCRSEYGSTVYDSSLSCNPSGPIATAAQQNGYGDATYTNSFGFHYCTPSDCVKVLCSGNTCNGALSYIDASKPHGYTLCIK